MNFWSTRYPWTLILTNEMAIICEQSGTVGIFDFSSFECFRNAANSVTLSSPWRGVWRSKGVDEEPLEPFHHMEVYKEVLEYFGELRMNCQSAIKCCAAVGPDIARFNLGFDLIGSR